MPMALAICQSANETGHQKTLTIFLAVFTANLAFGISWWICGNIWQVFSPSAIIATHHAQLTIELAHELAHDTCVSQIQRIFFPWCSCS
jgi:hypothetical protein